MRLFITKTYLFINFVRVISINNRSLSKAPILLLNPFPELRGLLLTGRKLTL